MSVPLGSEASTIPTQMLLLLASALSAPRLTSPPRVPTSIALTLNSDPSVYPERIALTPLSRTVPALSTQPTTLMTRSCALDSALWTFSTTMLRATSCGPCATSLSRDGVTLTPTIRAGSRTRLLLPRFTSNDQVILRLALPFVSIKFIISCSLITV